MYILSYVKILILTASVGQYEMNILKIYVIFKCMTFKFTISLNSGEANVGTFFKPLHQL